MVSDYKNKKRQNPSKLQLNKETIDSLSDSAIAEFKGGMVVFNIDKDDVKSWLSRMGLCGTRILCL